MIEHLGALLAPLDGPVLLVNEEQTIVCANRAAEEWFGAGLAGQPVYACMRQPEALNCIGDALASEGRSEARILHSDGRLSTAFRLVAGFVAIEEWGFRGCVVALTDLSKSDEAEQMRKDFVANVSHELKSPLTSLLAAIETLKIPAGKERKSRDRILELMQAEAVRMDRLISDLLSLARLESEERVQPRDLIEVGALLESVEESLAELAERSSISLSVSRPDGDSIVLGDRDQLRQVFWNLAENALKYGGQGGEVRIAVSREQRVPGIQGAALAISVSDQGPGIERIHLPRLTERFYRADRHRSRDLGGTGLGLAIVKHIVNRHRGRLSISSEVGKGSEFTVLLPLAEDEQAQGMQRAGA